MGGGTRSCGATAFLPPGTPKQRNPRALRRMVKEFLRSWNNLFIQTFLQGFKRVVLQCLMSLQTLFPTMSGSSKALHLVVPVKLVAPFTLIAHGSLLSDRSL